MRNWVYTLCLGLIACTAAKEPASVPTGGQALLNAKGCLACHSINGQPGIAPTFLKLYGKTETLTDGSRVTVDEAYLKESIRNPAAKVVQRYQPVMPVVPITDAELTLIVDYLKTLK